ncbi:MAG: SpoIIE family protein phosphatase [bacterium]|nr:SpoIIE family protein phosphatase [bacterium]
MQVLLVDPTSQHVPQGSAQFLADGGWAVTTAGDFAAATEQIRTGQFDATIIGLAGPGAPRDAAHPYQDLMREVDARRMAGVVLSDAEGPIKLQADSLVDVAPGPLSKQQLRCRLETVLRYQAMLRRMEGELSNMERLGKRLNQHFTEVDQEMRLAGRLQRDFLPQINEPLGPLRFSTLYRPASWVSGDIYDFFRVDEQHVAFYVADAVGHGMAASLLTMFIKKAISAKRIHDGGYELLTPSETVAGLNDALTAQALPNCQFVTACYCLINTDTLEMQYARGGHPYPLLISTDGSLTELRSAGGLLGLFPGDEYPTRTIQLKPGEKVILYTDGLEFTCEMDQDEPDKLHYYRQVFERLAPLPADEMVGRIATRLDAEAGSLNPRDDVTVLAVEIGDPTA